MRIEKIPMIVLLCFLFAAPVRASDENGGEDRQEKILDSMELEQVQEAVNELLGEETFHVKGSIQKALAGEAPFSIGQFWEIEKSFYINSFYRIKKFLFR